MRYYVIESATGHCMAVFEDGWEAKCYLDELSYGYPVGFYRIDFH